MAQHYSNLEKSEALFSKMLGRFGVVTVMNAKVYNFADWKDTIESHNAYDIYLTVKDTKPLCTLDTLKVANVTIEGPTKTVTGGKYANTLIKYGKTARLEMQDALGNAEAIEALCGGVVEYEGSLNGNRIGLHNGSDFAGPKFIIGDSFFIDQESGKQVDVVIMFYQFNPDSVFNLTQDAEGDATVFDMNGDLLTTEIMVGHSDGNDEKHGVFYSIIDPKHTSDHKAYFTTNIETSGAMTLTAGTGYSVEPTTIAKDAVARVKVTETKTSKVVLDTIIKNY